MKVELRDLKHNKWFIDSELSATIGELKSLNVEHQKLAENANQKLIYSGKILKDTETLESINYTGGKYIVCMISKTVAKSAPKPAPEPTTPKATEEPVPPRPSSPLASGPSVFAVGPQLQGAVKNIMDMGFTQNQVTYAMQRAYNNPDRAVEYLVTGQVPENVDEIMAQRQAPSSPVDRTAAVAPSSGLPSPSLHQAATRRNSNGGSSENEPHVASTIDMNLIDGIQEEAELNGSEFRGYDFKEILGVSDADIDAMRNAVANHPERLVDLLRPILGDNAPLSQFLAENMDEFLTYLDPTGVDDEFIREHLAEGGEGTDALESVDTPTLEITQEENDAIERLMRLGFTRPTVISAFFACEKNEMMAANYLLEYGNEDDSV